MNNTQRVVKEDHWDQLQPLDLENFIQLVSITSTYILHSFILGDAQNGLSVAPKP